MGRANLKMRRFTVGVLAAALIAASAEANPVGDFFKRVGRTISKPPASKTTTRRTATHTSSKRTDASPSPTATPVSVATAIVSTPPPQEASTQTPVIERPAVREPQPRAAPRQDLPYGVPVPGRAGFVTSPYAPTRGLVDVRGFAAGTEVRDPYSGKVFLTP